jgi:hypothetical protein
MNKNKKSLYRLSIIAISVAGLFGAYAVFAQDSQTKKTDSDRLKEVEVVGTSPLPGIGIEKDKLPYDVQTVTDDQLYRGQSLNLTDYMSRNLLGVNINEVQGSPFQADITYRGFRLSGILGSSQGMSVYLDGVRVNEPFGDVVNWDRMTVIGICRCWSGEAICWVTDCYQVIAMVPMAMIRPKRVCTKPIDAGFIPILTGLVTS